MGSDDQAFRNLCRRPGVLGLQSFFQNRDQGCGRVQSRQGSGTQTTPAHGFVAARDHQFGHVKTSYILITEYVARQCTHHPLPDSAGGCTKLGWVPHCSCSQGTVPCCPLLPPHHGSNWPHLSSGQPCSAALLTASLCGLLGYTCPSLFVPILSRPGLLPERGSDIVTSMSQRAIKDLRLQKDQAHDGSLLKHKGISRVIDTDFIISHAHQGFPQEVLQTS